jgi:hypothetical protein
MANAPTVANTVYYNQFMHPTASAHYQNFMGTPAGYNMHPSQGGRNQQQQYWGNQS